ncbi:DUF4265 domain-containing protein [Nocardia sp. 2]|uniref:DUF4265 domain-containing protein n=1 Tax=Nocardia acididurans TaxID=2802282 RepID=A0ABS1M9I3_9NOCA|nr:DUF4265 domain-containing protein [Nocardia acididurans]MBL1075818.1 DUF4265 domain-containing protein [Nocardia acididurans]
MSDDQSACGSTHVQVIAGANAAGEPVYEVLPAKLLEHNDYEILGSPALTYDFAAGDHLRVFDDGRFEVLRRGGNLCLRAYPKSSPPSDVGIRTLTAAFDRLGGVVEMPSDRRFIVITVPVTAGFVAIQDAIEGWATEHGCVWGYGNVYDEDDNPLDWWITT